MGDTEPMTPRQNIVDLLIDYRRLLLSGSSLTLQGDLNRVSRLARIQRLLNDDDELAKALTALLVDNPT
jgi:hypothetical protein